MPNIWHASSSLRRYFATTYHPYKMATETQIEWRHCHRIVLTVQEATSPVFTLDGQYLLYVDRGCTVIAYSLSDLAPRYHVPDCPAHQLIAVPQHHRLFLATRFDADETSQKTAVVSVADLNSRYIRF